VNAELLLYALVATVSPFGFAATLAVIAGGRGKALLFALGFVLGQVSACAFVVFVGVSLVPRDRDNPVLRGVLELAFGVGLVWLALVYRRRSMRGIDVPSPGRSTDLLARLRRLRPVTAALGGLVLGIGGPKRLLLTVLAGTSIAASRADGAEGAALVLAYSAVATLFVWLPILAFAIAGHRVGAKLDAMQGSLAAHEREIGFYSLLAIGALAMGHSVSLIS
jgi:cytochrome c biogenesis protein CcdA